MRDAKPGVIMGNIKDDAEIVEIVEIVRLWDCGDCGDRNKHVDIAL